MGAQLEYKQLYLKFLSDEKLIKPVIEAKTYNGVAVQLSSTANVSTVASNELNVETTAQPLPTFITPLATTYYDFPQLDETANVAANLLENYNRKPLRFVVGVLNKHNLNVLQSNTTENVAKPIIFVPKFEAEIGSLAVKTEASEPLWGFKQKKYKRLQKFLFSNNDTRADQFYNSGVTTSVQSSPAVLAKQVIDNHLAASADNAADSIYYHKSIKFNRQRSELVPVNLARRLLRTKRTLVLPAHVNITIITNSYDVVHS